MKRITFEKPPLVEAFCEFRFAGGEPWDWTVPGRFYGSIELDYPQRSEQQFVKVQMTPTANGLTPGVQGGVDRLQFRSAQGHRVVQVGPDLLSIHQLTPYSNWIDFKAEVERVLNFYWSAAKSEHIIALSLRYINHVPLSSGKIYFEDFFAIMPNLPGDKEEHWLSWAQKVDVLLPEHHAILSVQSGTVFEDNVRPPQFAEVGAQPEIKVAVLLDFTFSHDGEQPLQPSDISNWLDTAHDNIELRFSESLRPQLKELLGYKENDETNI